MSTGDDIAHDLLVVASPDLADVCARTAFDEPVRVRPAGAPIDDLPTLELHDPTIDRRGAVICLPSSAPRADGTLVAGDGALLRLGDSLVAVVARGRPDAEVVRRAATAESNRAPFAAELIGDIAAPGDTGRLRRFRTDTSFLVVRLGTVAVGEPGAPGLEPVTLDLARHGVVRLEGDLDAARAVARSIIVQLVALRRPADLRVAPLQPTVEWAWLKGLPHFDEVKGPLDEELQAAHDDARVAERDGRNDVHTVYVADPLATTPASGAGPPPTLGPIGDDGVAPTATLLAIGPADAGDAVEATIVLHARTGLLGLTVSWAGGSLEVPWPDGLTRGRCEAAAPPPPPEPRSDPAPPPRPEEPTDDPPGAVALGEGVDLPIGAGDHLLVTGASGQGKTLTLKRIALEISRREDLDARMILVDGHRGAFHLFAGGRAVADVIGRFTEPNDLSTVRRVARGLAALVEERATRAPGPADPVTVVVLDELGWALLRGEPGAHLRRVLHRCLVDGERLGIQVVAATQGLPDTELRDAFRHRLAFYGVNPDESRELVGDAIRKAAPGHALAGIRPWHEPRFVAIPDPGEALPSPGPTRSLLGAGIPLERTQLPDQRLSDDEPSAPLRAVVGWQEGVVDDPRWVLDLDARPVTLFVGHPVATRSALTAVAASLAERSGELAVHHTDHLDDDHLIAVIREGPDLSPAPLVILAASVDAATLATLCDLGADRGGRPLVLVAGVDHHPQAVDDGIIRLVLADPVASTMGEARWLDDGVPSATADLSDHGGPG